MDLDTLIHTFTFDEDNRAQITFSDSSKIRLDPATGLIQLKKQANGKYPTDADIHVVTPLFQPKAARQWLGFQAFITHVKTALAQVTSDGFRLSDGTDQYRWDGAAWIVDTAAWNTEAEIAANISTFPVTARKLALVINLATTDPAQTPWLKMAKVAWNAKINYIEDTLYRSLVPAVRGVQTLVDFAYKVAFPGGTSLSLTGPLKDSGIPLNVVGVDSVYDHTTDPEHLTDLLSSYNPATKVVTLSTAVPVGDKAFFQLICEPEVAINQASQDYVEVEKAPALIIQDIESVDSSPLSQDDYVVNKATGDAIVVKAPYRFDIRFTMIALAPGGVDLVRLIESIVGYVENNPLLKSPALDRSYRIWMIQEFKTQTRPNRAGLHTSQAQFVIKDVLAFTKPAQTGKAILSLKFRGDMNTETPFTP